MIKVNVKKRSSKVISWSGVFDTEQEANDWVSQHVANNSWGRPERWIRADANDVLPSSEDKKKSDDVRVVILDAKTSINEYYFKADYVIELVNVRLLPKLESLRSQRNAKLYDCDWTQLPDSPLSSQKRQQWAQYRQDLRDMFQDDELEVDSPSWPSKPGK